MFCLYASFRHRIEELIYQIIEYSRTALAKYNTNLIVSTITFSVRTTLANFEDRI